MKTTTTAELMRKVQGVTGWNRVPRCGVALLSLTHPWAFRSPNVRVAE